MLFQAVFFSHFPASRQRDSPSRRCAPRWHMRRFAAAAVFAFMPPFHAAVLMSCRRRLRCFSLLPSFRFAAADFTPFMFGDTAAPPHLLSPPFDCRCAAIARHATPCFTRRRVREAFTARCRAYAAPPLSCLIDVADFRRDFLRHLPPTPYSPPEIFIAASFRPFFIAAAVSSSAA